ncbi:MAG: hypothetical protein M0023_01840 [Desulfobacteraceae bacterium]|nr:hypothetical protein [Desulfobacteraceae bacterium]
MKHCYRIMMIFVMVSLCSCAYALKAKQANIREEFNRSMKEYNKMLRWRDIENAGMIYLDPELRDEYMKSAEDIKKRGVTITDYRILTSECTPEKGTAEVIAEFDYYALPSNRIKTLTYHQKWTYLDTEDKKGWQLKSGLPPFD